MNSLPVVQTVSRGRTNRGTASNFVLRKRIRKLRQLIARNTYEFCSNTTLHGLRYLTHEHLFRFEKIFFALSFICVVFVSGFFSLNVYNKWSKTPVILSISSSPSLIVTEPFPAVTVCNLNQAIKTRAKVYSIFSTEYAMLQMLCKRDVNVSVANTINDWGNLDKFITQVSQPCGDMLLRCKFGAVDYNCSEIFFPVITDEGLCCAFNMVHPDFMYRNSSIQSTVTLPPDDKKAKAVKWSVESGYGKINLTDNFYPRNTIGTGESLGFSLTLDVDVDNYYCSSSNSLGFKILLHTPTERPAIREIGLLLAAGRETKIRIRPTKMEADEDIRKMHISNRRCAFEDETKLDIFKKYSQRNCVVECFVKMLIYFCGCIPHYLPKISGNETVCSIYDSSCLDRTYYESMITAKDEKEYSCNDQCVPSCFDMTYEPDFFTSKLSHSGFQVTNQVLKNISSDYVEKNIAMVTMYFKDNTYRSNIQAEYIGATDFLASVGGLIGLFFGFSFISIAELIFFFIIHPWHGLRKQVQKEANIAQSPPPEYSAIERRRFKKPFKSNRFIRPAVYPLPTDVWAAGVTTNTPAFNRDVLRNISNSVERRNLRNGITNQWHARQPFIL